MSTEGGYPNKKLHKYANIMKFLESEHEDVYKIFDDLGMNGSLSPRRVDGITLLLPDKKLVGKMQKLIESENIEQAGDILQSLILLDVFKNPGDFSKKEIVTLSRKKMTASVKGDKVELLGGTAVKNDKFKPFERSGQNKRDNLAVWDFTGEPDTSSGVDAPYKKREPKSAKSKQEEVEGGDENLNTHLDIIEGAETKLTWGKNDNGERQSAKLKAIHHVLSYFKEHNPKLLKVAKWVLTCHPYVDFELLFHNRSLFSAEHLEAALKGFSLAASNVTLSSVKKILCECECKTSDAYKQARDAIKDAAVQEGVTSSVLDKLYEKSHAALDADVKEAYGKVSSHRNLDEFAFTLLSILDGLEDKEAIEHDIKEHRTFYGSDPTVKNLATPNDPAYINFLKDFAKSFAGHSPICDQTDYFEKSYYGGDENDDNLVEDL